MVVSEGTDVLQS